MLWELKCLFMFDFLTNYMPKCVTCGFHQLSSALSWALKQHMAVFLIVITGCPEWSYLFPSDRFGWYLLVQVSTTIMGKEPISSRFYDILSSFYGGVLMRLSYVGILFGFLYWRYGVEAAIISHFSAVIVLHVILKNKIHRK